MSEQKVELATNAARGIGRVITAQRSDPAAAESSGQTLTLGDLARHYRLGDPDDGQA